jgi:hypothetical protein
MPRINAPVYVRVSLVLVLLCALAPTKGALASSEARADVTASAPANYMVCWTTTGSVFYVSDVFDAGPPPAGPRGRQGNALGQVFLAFLQRKYALTANDHAICGGPPAATPESTQAYKQEQEERAKKANQKIVDTGWKEE